MRTPPAQTRNREATHRISRRKPPRGINISRFAVLITRGGFLWSGGIYRTPVTTDIIPGYMIYSRLAFFITEGCFLVRVISAGGDSSTMGNIRYPYYSSSAGASRATRCAGTADTAAAGAGLAAAAGVERVAVAGSSSAAVGA